MRKFAGTTALAGLASVVMVFGGCGPTREEVAELKAKQSEIIAKLDQVKEKVDQIAARPAAPAAQAASGPDPAKVYTLPVGTSALKGPPDAPITIVEFSDYQCPFCSRVEPVLNEVLKAYPTQVKWSFKHFPLTSIHQFAMGASKAAIAAQKQGKFWEMHDKLFANQRDLQPEKLKKYAQEIGLDVAKWEADMNSPEVQNQIQEDGKLAQSVQIRGTPTLFLNGKIFQGRTAEDYKKAIDEALKH